MKLGNNDAFGAVDNERATLGHHGDFAHVNFFVLDVILFAKTELHVKWHGISHPIAQAFDLAILRISQGIGNILQRQAGIVGLDGKYLTKHGLEALQLALFFRQPFLEEIQIGRDLNLDQVWRRNDFAKIAEVFAIRLCAVGHVYTRLDEVEGARASLTECAAQRRMNGMRKGKGQAALKHGLS